jgi:hypothetical protein
VCNGQNSPSQPARQYSNTSIRTQGLRVIICTGIGNNRIITKQGPEKKTNVLRSVIIFYGFVTKTFYKKKI